MSVQEGLGGLRRVGLDEAAVAVGQVQDEAVGLLLHAADDHQGLAEVALGEARGMGQGHEHLFGPPSMLSDVILDDGVLAVEPVLVPEPLEDALGRVALLPGDHVIVFEDPVDDARKGLLLSLSKGWAAGAWSASGSPVARSRPASSVQCPGAARTPGRPPGCSCPPPSPPCGPADTIPLCTFPAPSIGSKMPLWMAEGGPIFNRRLSVGQSAHPVQFTSADYSGTRASGKLGCGISRNSASISPSTTFPSSTLSANLCYQCQIERGLRLRTEDPAETTQTTLGRRNASPETKRG